MKMYFIYTKLGKQASSNGANLFPIRKWNQNFDVSFCLGSFDSCMRDVDKLEILYKTHLNFLKYPEKITFY
jgi:hypothetical protein